MNPTDTTLMPKQQNERNEPSGSELIAYQTNQTPIDFTEFLNIDDEPILNINTNGL